ncbi:MAG TPA: hypothetical protein VJ376_05760 [Pseudomonadota bacterium]|nr:hypothetical protein [Pseudomonadota bacterium]
MPRRERSPGGGWVQSNARTASPKRPRRSSADVDPADDVHASSAYRRHLAGVLAERALEKALARAGGGVG